MSLLSLLAFAAAGVFSPNQLAVDIQPDEHWWGVCNGFGREMPFTASTDFACDLRLDNYGHQSLSLLVSDKGRALWCPDPVGVRIAGGEITFASDNAKIELFEKSGSKMPSTSTMSPHWQGGWASERSQSWVSLEFHDF